MTLTTHLPPNWRERVLAMVNAHGWLEGAFAPEAKRLMLAWQRAEGGSAQWNPLNTTLRIPGSHDLAGNPAGVQEYARPVDGCCATAMTLANGFYGGILGDLQNGTKTAEEIVRDRRDQFATWGTKPDSILAVLATL